MHHRYPLLLPLVLLICGVGQLFAQDRFWRPYVEAELRGGELWTQQGNLFVPLHQTQVNMLFADFRGNWTTRRPHTAIWVWRFGKC